MSYNQHNIRKQEHLASVSGPKILQKIHTGMGVNCDDPFSPTIAERHPFYEIGSNDGVATPVVSTDDVLRAQTSFIETQDVRSMADSLRANMRASYNFASAEASYNQTSESMRRKKVILALLSSTKAGDGLAESKLIWSKSDKDILSQIEKESNAIKRQDDFVRQFGSHYVGAIEFGYRLAISGEYETESKEDKTAFAAAFKATFGAGDVGGGVSAATRSYMESTKTTIRSEIVCGGIEPDTPLIMGTYAEVAEFLKKLRDGTIKISRGPVQFSARSYYSSLLGFPKIQSVLGTQQAVQIDSPYGVPRGTVIAWYPPNEAIIEEDGARRIMIPGGWAIANGINHSLNMNDRFARGAVDPLTFGQVGGENTHVHSGVVETADRGAWLGAGGGDQQFVRADYQYRFTSQPAGNIPPYVDLVYLVKL